MNQLFKDAKQSAEFLGYPNVQAFEYDRQAGKLPPPDTVFAKMPYWSIGTLEEIIHAKVSGIRAAFGYPASEEQHHGNV